MKNNKGFTLLELSIVLIILGFLTTTSLTVTRGYINYQKHAETKEKIKRIETAINEYVLKNKKLPCPAAINKDYKNATAEENCDATRNVDGVLIGAIPADDLGIDKKDLADAWNNKITYFVVENYTNSNNFMNYTEDDDLINNKFAYAVISASSNRNSAYPYTSTSAKNVDKTEYDYDNSYDGFNGNLVFDEVDDIMTLRTKTNIIQSLALYDMKCNIDFSSIKTEITEKCGSSYFSSVSNATLNYGEKELSSEDEYTAKTITQPDGTQKTIYTQLKKCVVECSKYGRPVIYLQITDI